MPIIRNFLLLAPARQIFQIFLFAWNFLVQNVSFTDGKLQI